MNETVIECVPNFSEGCDHNKVRAIVDAMRVDGVSLSGLVARRRP